MIETNEGFMAVFTKYDSIFECINEPYFKDITMGAEFLSDMCDYHQYHIKNIENGLEGVKFVHYDIN